MPYRFDEPPVAVVIIALALYLYEFIRKGTKAFVRAVVYLRVSPHLNAKGRTFDKWLTNAKYTGEFTFGGRLCNNTYPAIIDKALFERVQKRLAKNRYFAGGTATARVPYILTGKAFCTHCNAALISDGGTSRTGQQHHYYICKGRKKAFARNAARTKTN